MIDLLDICAVNAAYADAIDSDSLERWPEFFTAECHYRITTAENERDGLAAGIVFADSRAMLEDRVAALREANIYERQQLRHLIGLPLLESSESGCICARTPFVIARIMHTGETMLFATGVYLDCFVRESGEVRLQMRVAVCDSSVTDTLLALPL